MRKLKLYFVVIVFLIVGIGLLGVYYKVEQRRAAARAAAERARNQKAPEVQVRIIEGLTNEETYASLEQQELGTAKEYEKAEDAVEKSDFSFLSSKPNKESLLGYLFPDTYRFHSDATGAEVIAKLLETFELRFSKAAQKSVTTANGTYTIPSFESANFDGIGADGLTIHQLVTLASVVEKETGGKNKTVGSQALDEERQTVAGIFYNRLALGMPLQSDATVNFITKSGRASATAADLEVDSPYNTYKYRGLPKGPIANVSYSSLYAVLHPKKTDYYYFLHSQSTGEVYYARNFEEHKQNKARYLK